ncbi:hypothetical protein V0288_04035 [Pannus brasiliensis CCIBt3594]|uniref:tRNA nuclease CdiA C-terminal domain-containing protein n=1 Tax=Pannus brasiliensis CCIBt3594 TaxID=1427578 RepID=A0AAW9QMA9_9CHRO
MNSRYRQESRSIYNNAISDYDRYYFDEKTGGFVLIHENHNINDSERFIAEVFARLGNRVTLLDERAESGVKTPDADINGDIWEFKELSPDAVSIKNTIQRGVASGKKSAPNVAYYINHNRADIRDINRGITRALVWDTDEYLQKLALVFNDGSLQLLSREELDNGECFREF